MKRRIMREFRIHELSGVDRPAQEGARAVIMKRDDAQKNLTRDYASPRMLSDAKGHTHILDDSSQAGETSASLSAGSDVYHSHPWIRKDSGELVVGAAEGHSHTVLEKRNVSAQQRENLAGKGKALPGGGFPIANKRDLKNAIAAFGRAKDKAKVAAFIKQRAKALGAMDLLPKDGVLASFLKKGMENMDEKETEALQERLEKAEAALKRAQTVAALSQDCRKFLDALPKEEQDGFLAKSAEGQDALVAAEAARNVREVVYTTDAGEEYLKSDDPRLVAMARQGDSDRRELAAERAARTNDVLTKRAGDELSNLPGDAPVKVALLSAISGIGDQKLREGAEAILKAADKAASGAFENLGSAAPGTSDAEQELAKRANETAAKSGTTYAKAYLAVLQTPEGRGLYRQMREES